MTFCSIRIQTGWGAVIFFLNLLVASLPRASLITITLTRRGNLTLRMDMFCSQHQMFPLLPFLSSLSIRTCETPKWRVNTRPRFLSSPNICHEGEKKKIKKSIPSFNQPFVLCDLNLRLNGMHGGVVEEGSCGLTPCKIIGIRRIPESWSHYLPCEHFCIHI